MEDQKSAIKIIEILRSSHCACLVARKWAEVRKWGSIIAYFPIYPNTRKEK